MSHAPLPTPPATLSSLGAAFQSHPVPTLLVSGEGKVVDANQAAEALFNAGRASLVDRDLVSVMELGTPGGLARMLAQPETSAWAYAVELTVAKQAPLYADIALGPIGKDGEWRVLAIHPVPATGRMPFRRPGSAARSAGGMAAMLAHEIKNPLSGIRGAAQLLGKGGSTSAAALSRLICGEVDRIAGLIDGMQSFTRNEPPPRTSINIYPAIGQARGIAAQGFASGVRFIEEFDPSLPRVLANHDSLVQILINLIKNACEAAEDKADLSVRLTTAYRHGLSWDAGDGKGQQPLPVEIIVADNGPGVPEHLTEVLFDPFVSGKRDGQGLGLALVDKLVRDMGGVVQHDRKNGWTRFRLNLALARAGEGEGA